MWLQRCTAVAVGGLQTEGQVLGVGQRQERQPVPPPRASQHEYLAHCGEPQPRPYSHRKDHSGQPTSCRSPAPRNTARRNTARRNRCGRVVHAVILPLGWPLAGAVGQGPKGTGRALWPTCQAPCPPAGRCGLLARPVGLMPRHCRSANERRIAAKASRHDHCGTGEIQPGPQVDLGLGGIEKRCAEPQRH